MMECLKYHSFQCSLTVFYYNFEYLYFRKKETVWNQFENQMLAFK